MIYKEYEAIWCKIRKQEKKLLDLINKREELFEKTQPKGTKYDKEIVDGKNPKNAMEEYIIQKEYLTERIEQLNLTLDDMYQVLKRKREELKLSKNIYDMIYYYYCIEKLSVYKIVSLVHYSKSQIYRKLDEMNIKIARWDKMGKKVC